MDSLFIGFAGSICCANCTERRESMDRWGIVKGKIPQKADQVKETAPLSRDLGKKMKFFKVGQLEGQLKGKYASPTTSEN